MSARAQVLSRGDDDRVERTAARRVLGSLARWTPLAVWFSCIVVIMAALALSHQFSLASLDRQNAKLAAGIAALLPHARGEWAAIHVLYAQCQCSQRIVQHLGASRRPAKLREVVLLAGDDPGQAIASRLAPRGFQLISVAAEALATRFGIEGAPLFMLVDPARSVRYLGGYTSRKQGPDIRDLAIMREIRQGDRVADLPVFGCAVSQRLKAFFEPFGPRR